MKRQLLLICGLWLSLAACKAGHVCYQQADSLKICRLLTEAQKQGDAVNPLFFAKKFLGLPYVAHTLEVQDEEGLVVNTRQLDCTTFVETITALTLCARNKTYTWADYLKQLTAMRYRGGNINRYPSRIHYFTEWIMQNNQRGIVTDIQKPNPPFSGVQTVKVSYMSTHPDAYKALKQHPEYVPEIRKMEQRVSGNKFFLIPRDKVKNTQLLRETIHDGDIIAITCTKPGLDIAHLGFALWREDGLHFLHASMMRKKVLVDPLLLGDYLKINSAYTGIRVIRINK